MTKSKRRVTIIVAAIAAVILLIGSSLIFVIYRHEEISETLISTFHLKKALTIGVILTLRKKQKAKEFLYVITTHFHLNTRTASFT